MRRVISILSIVLFMSSFFLYAEEKVSCSGSGFKCKKETKQVECEKKQFCKKDCRKEKCDKELKCEKGKCTKCCEREKGCGKGKCNIVNGEKAYKDYKKTFFPLYSKSHNELTGDKSFMFIPLLSGKSTKYPMGGKFKVENKYCIPLGANKFCFKSDVVDGEPKGSGFVCAPLLMFYGRGEYKDMEGVGFNCTWLLSQYLRFKNSVLLDIVSVPMIASLVKYQRYDAEEINEYLANIDDDDVDDVIDKLKKSVGKMKTGRKSYDPTQEVLDLEHYAIEGMSFLRSRNSFSLFSIIYPFYQ